jgi:hypothetical protein
VDHRRSFQSWHDENITHEIMVMRVLQDPFQLVI